MDNVSSLEGAQDCLESGIHSSILRHNKKIGCKCETKLSILESWRWSLMLDPQTSEFFQKMDLVYVMTNDSAGL